MEKEKWWKTVWADWNAKPWFYIFTACIGTTSWLLALILYRLYQQYPIEKSGDLAAWVQAIGSVIAIFVAIVLPIIMHKKTIDKEKALERSEEMELINCLNEEFQQNKKNFQLLLDDFLRNTADDDRNLSSHFPIPENTFPFYESTTQRFSKIKSNIVRRNYILAYTYSKVLLKDIAEHNDSTWVFYESKKNQDIKSQHLYLLKRRKPQSNFILDITKYKVEARHAEHEIERVRHRIKENKRLIRKRYRMTIEAIDKAIGT